MASTPELTKYFQCLSALGHEEIRHRKANGETMHLAPIGYRNSRHDGRSVIEPDPDTNALVWEAKLLRHDGHSIRKICRIMAKRGMRSSRGKQIGPSSMHLLLSRRSELTAAIFPPLSSSFLNQK